MFKKGLVLSMILAVIFAANVSQAYSPVPGDLLRTAGDATVVLVMDDGTRVPISADGFAVRYNNNFGLVKVVTLTERGSFDADRIINATSSLFPGTVFMYEVDEPGIYLIENGYKRVFSTWTGFEARGHSLFDVQWIGLYTQYPTGTPIP